MKSRVTILFVFVAVLGFYGCGDDNGSSSNQVTFSGNYNGTIQDSVNGAGTVRASLTQNGTGVTGTFQTTYGSVTGGGNLSGTASGSSLSATILPNDPNTDCPYNLNANLNGRTISGTYAAFNCTVNVTGTFTASK